VFVFQANEVSELVWEHAAAKRSMSSEALFPMDDFDE
jgi:hypothetical protein